MAEMRFKSPYKALEVSTEIDLRVFSGYLGQLGIAHRISESSGRQELWVEDESSVERVHQLYRQLTTGELRLHQTRIPRTAGPTLAARMLQLCRLYPGTLFFIGLSLLFSPVAMSGDEGSFNSMLHYFTFVDFAVRDGAFISRSFPADVAAGQVWRLWTPMLLHFSLMHIVFNLLWVWEIGRRIELVNGTRRIFNLVMVAGLFSNMAQYLVSGGIVFGGMSGVVYALLGYSLVWSRLRPKASFHLPDGVYVFMLIWLVLGWTGLLDLFGTGAIANGAHAGGLVTGIAAGLFAVLRAPDQPQPGN